MQLSVKGLQTPLYIGERVLKEGISLSWENIEKIRVATSTIRRADGEKEIRLYQKDQLVDYLHSYYTQKQLFYVLALLQLYHQQQHTKIGEEELDLIDLSDHLLE